MKTFDELWQAAQRMAGPDDPWTPAIETMELACAAHALMSCYGKVFIYPYGAQGAEVVIHPTGKRMSLIIHGPKCWQILELTEAGTIVIPDDVKALFDAAKEATEE